MLNDWHWALLVLFTGISPFAHQVTKSQLSSSLTSAGGDEPTCSSLLSRTYHPLVGHVITTLYDWLGTPDQRTCRAVNLQLHAANSILLFVVINQLLASQRLYSRDMRQQTSALAAILFAVHPTRADVTSQTLGIEDSLSLALSLIGVLCLLPIFADKLVHIYAPASSLFFIAAGLVQSSAADVPVVLAFLLAFQVFKIPAHSGKRFTVGACLLLPIIVLFCCEMWGSSPLALEGSLVASPLDTSGSSGQRRKAFGGSQHKSRSKGGDLKSAEGASTADASGGSVVLRVCVGICEVLWQHIDGFTRSSDGSKAADQIWKRDIATLAPLPSAFLLTYVTALVYSVAHTVLRILVGLRAHSWTICLLAFSVLCTRSALPPGSVSASAGSSYLPGCFLSIVLSFALVDAWAAPKAASAAASGSEVEVVSRAALDSLSLNSNSAADTAPAMSLNVQIIYRSLSTISALYILHQWSD